MAVTAKRKRFERELKLLKEHRSAPKNSKLKPRQIIRIRLRCRLCGRPRAIYRKFGVCRICFRNMAAAGLIPGVKKASW